VKRMNLLFILGTGRCGSTMVQEVLARHPDVGFISNFDANLPLINSKGRWNNALYRLTPPALSQRDRRFARLARLRLRFGPSEAYRMLNRRVSLMISEPFRDITADDVTPWLRDRFRRFFEERMQAQRKPVLVCKFAGWPRAGFIHEIFPHARFLHVIRDGRAVADSLIRRPWWRGYGGAVRWQFGPLPDVYEAEWETTGYSFVALAGLQWKMVMDAFWKARQTIPSEQWMDIRYEDFVASPDKHAHDILRFADLEPDRTFESGLRRYQFTTDRKDTYRENLTAAQVELLNRILADHLARLGYVSQPDRPSTFPSLDAD
jgi:hypothetical protein